MPAAQCWGLDNSERGQRDGPLTGNAGRGCPLVRGGERTMEHCGASDGLAGTTAIAGDNEATAGQPIGQRNGFRGGPLCPLIRRGQASSRTGVRHQQGVRVQLA